MASHSTVEPVLCVRQEQCHGLCTDPHQLRGEGSLGLGHGRGVVRPCALGLGVAQAEHARRRLPEVQLVVRRRVGGQVFAVRRVRHSRHGAAVGRQRLHPGRPHLVHGQLTGPAIEMLIYSPVNLFKNVTMVTL